MSDFTEILAHWARRRAEPLALASVVRTSGSTYRRAGARMLIAPDATTVGMISGGCLERDVAERARRVVRSGQPELVPYDTRRLFGCNGALEIFIEAIADQAAGHLLAAAESSLRERRTLLGATVFARDGAVETPLGSYPLLASAHVPSWLREGSGPALAAGHPRERSHRLAEGEASVLWQGIVPPLQLLIFGAGPDVLPLVEFARSLGWSTVVVMHPAQDPPELPPGCALLAALPEEAAASLTLDDRTAAVVMTHHYGRDLASLAALLPLPLRYVGLMGPKSRREKILADLADAGLVPTPPMLARLHSPAGLDIGADGPREIALAIASEVQSVLAGRTGGPLRERAGGIHARAEAPV